MSALLPVAFYGLEVPPGEVMVPAAHEFPAQIQLTMAAIDPTAEPTADADGNVPSTHRSTLKIFRSRADIDEDDDSEDYLQSLLNDGSDDDEDEDEDDEPNGGPSDPAKSKKARQEAAIKKLLESTNEESDEEMEDSDEKPNGKSKKGKGRASDDDDDESSSDSELDGLDLEDYVICTLDDEKNYQQPISIVLGEGEKIFFSVSGTHSIHLTGNYVIPPDEDEEDSDEDEDDYDLPPGIEDLADEYDDGTSDELDDVDSTPRIKEIDTDEEEAPQLVAADSKKGKNKRPAQEDAQSLDDMIAKDEAKLSKKQLKKLKNNKGEAVASEAKDSPKTDKKVQFAKNLEQGPTGPAKDNVDQKAAKKDDKKTALGVKTVQGVTIDYRKLGNGRAAKSGDRVSMRYIGKLENGKVFDANKKGAPFSFKVGKGEVIKGWDIGIAGMTVGGERRLTIPAHLAYGSRSMPGIPANSTLVFDVKLLEIK